MSEGRQLALLVAGLVVLSTVGFAGAALFPDACARFQQEGDLLLRFEDASPALGLSVADGDALEDWGVEAGVGSWRGAVALPDDAEVRGSESGFFVVTADDVVVLRPGFNGTVSNPRGVTGDAVLPAHMAFGVQDDDGTVALYDGQLEELRCGALPVDAPVRLLDLDRGLSILSDEQDAVALTLNGDELWRRPLDPAWAWVVEREVAVAGPEGAVSVIVVDDGEVLTTVEGGPVVAEDARAARVLGEDAGGALVVLDVEQRVVERVEGPVAAFTEDGHVAVLPDGVVGAGPTPAGLELTRTGAAGAVLDLRGDLVVEDVVTSDDGVVGVVVRNGDLRAVVQWFAGATG